MKATSKKVTKSGRPAKNRKTQKEQLPNEVVKLSRSVFTNGQYCAAISVERPKT